MKSQGGSDKTSNGILVCPNHHGEIHNDLLSITDKKKMEELSIGKLPPLETEQTQ